MLIFIVVVIVLLALFVAAMQYVPILGEPFKSILILLAFVIAIAAIAQRAGIF